MTKFFVSTMMTFISAASAKLLFNETWVTVLLGIIGLFAGAALVEFMNELFSSQNALAARIHELYTEIKQDEEDDRVPGFPDHLP